VPVPQTFNYTLVALPLSLNYDSTNLPSPLKIRVMLSRSLS